MIEEIRKMIAVKLITWAFKVLPICEFKRLLATFIYDNLNKLK